MYRADANMLQACERTRYTVYCTQIGHNIRALIGACSSGGGVPNTQWSLIAKNGLKKERGDRIKEPDTWKSTKMKQEVQTAYLSE